MLNNPDILETKEMPLEERLPILRKAKGLSQEDLAEKLGVSRQTISRWESGLAVPSSDNLLYLAQLYGTTVDALLGREPPRQTPPAEDPLSPPPEAPAAAGKSRKRKIVLLCLGAAMVFLAGMLAGYFIAKPEQINLIGEEGRTESTITFHVGW